MTDLTLKLSEDNLKKLKAYTLLSGQDVASIEQKLSEIVSNVLGELLSEGIANSLKTMDGKFPAVVVPKEPDPVVVEDASTGNVLSEEDALEEVKALDEEPLNEDEIFKVDIKAKNAGSNAEAFVDAVIAQDSGRKKVPGRTTYNGSHRSGARKIFDPSTPRVTIGEFTGDEDTADFGFGM